MQIEITCSVWSSFKDNVFLLKIINRSTNKAYLIESDQDERINDVTGSDSIEKSGIIPNGTVVINKKYDLRTSRLIAEKYKLENDHQEAFEVSKDDYESQAYKLTAYFSEEVEPLLLSIWNKLNEPQEKESAQKVLEKFKIKTKHSSLGSW